MADLPVDPVTAYAQDVVSGAIVAGRAVRLAGARHLRDLQQQQTIQFPYYFDVAAAQHVINFFPAFLTLENGEPFHLPPWLQFCYGSIYGWKCWSGDGTVALEAEHVARAGYRRYQHGFFETSKGSGKSPSAAGIGLYGIAFDDEDYAQVYSTGFDKQQASIILDDAVRMAKGSDDLLDILLVDKYNIAHPGSGSFFRAMSSQHRSKSGPRPHYILSDEIHEHRDGTVVAKAEAGFKNRKQPLGLKFTNSGSDKTSYCWELHQKSLNILEGSLKDEQWFAYVCHLDPCEKHYQEGFRQPKDDCPDCDDWKNPAVWPKIAPALGIVIQPKYLQDAIDTAYAIPSEFNMKRRLNFCLWTETHQVWISSDRWDACKVDTVTEDNDALLTCAGGLDPSSVLDLCAFVIALRHDDPPGAEKPQEVVIEGMDEAGEQIRQIYTLNFSVELIPYFWLPRDTLNERVRKERIPFDQWSRLPDPKHPYLFSTPGGAIDHDAVYKFIVGDKTKLAGQTDEAAAQAAAELAGEQWKRKGAWGRYKMQRLGMDENQGRFLFMKLRDEGKLGEKIVSVGQGKKLSEAFKFMEILIAHRRLRHAGHPVLNWNVANAEPQRDRAGALWVEKPSEVKRIDGVVASAMAIQALMALPFRKRGPKLFFMGGGS